MFIMIKGKKIFLERGDLIYYKGMDYKISKSVRKVCLVLGRHERGVRCFGLNEQECFVWDGANYKLDNFKVIK